MTQLQMDCCMAAFTVFELTLLVYTLASGLTLFPSSGCCHLTLHDPIEHVCSYLVVSETSPS